MNKNTHFTNSPGWFDWLPLPIWVTQCLGDDRKSQNDQCELTSLKSQGKPIFPSFDAGNMGLPNPSNHCFMNSLLQCLLVLRVFKSNLKKASDYNFRANQLYNLFNAIERGYIGRNERKIHLNKLKEDLLSSISEATQGISILKEEGGDSRTLFLALCMSFTGKKPIKEDSIFSCFCIGDLVKEVTCPRCKTWQEYIENPLMLDVHEDLFSLGKQNENFLQSESELRKCKLCKEQTLHRKKITLTAFPEILALRIAETNEEELDKEACKTKMSLTFQDKEGKKVEYEFVSGIYNTQRGVNGCHSVAYVRNERVSNRFLMYSDEIVNDVCEDQINRYPKLLFYQKREKVREVREVRKSEEEPPRPIYDL